MCEKGPRPAETPPLKEVFKPRFGVLNFCGLPGTGKSTAIEESEQLLGIKGIDVGQDMRDLDEIVTGEKTLEYIRRDVSIDREFDERTARIIRNASPENPVIINSRLGPSITMYERAKAEEEGKSFPIIINILFWAKKRTRYGRILDRERTRHPEMNLTLQDIESREKDRTPKDKTQWKKVHPEWKGRLKGDLLSPKATFDGKPIYDIVIDTDKTDQEHVPLVIISYLVERGLLTRIDADPKPNGDDKPQLPPQGTIFEKDQAA